MTVTVTLSDGSPAVMRGGARQPFSYAPGVWVDVEGDEKKWKSVGSGTERRTDRVLVGRML